jgi:hypothetical protein
MFKKLENVVFTERGFEETGYVTNIVNGIASINGLQKNLIGMVVQFIDMQDDSSSLGVIIGYDEAGVLAYCFDLTQGQTGYRDCVRYLTSPVERLLTGNYFFKKIKNTVLYDLGLLTEFIFYQKNYLQIFFNLFIYSYPLPYNYRRKDEVIDTIGWSMDDVIIRFIEVINCDYWMDLKTVKPNKQIKLKFYQLAPFWHEPSTLESRRIQPNILEGYFAAGNIAIGEYAVGTGIYWLTDKDGWWVYPTFILYISFI